MKEAESVINKQKTNAENAVVTIDKARIILESRGKYITDWEINNLLSVLRILCNKAIDGVVEKDYSESKL